MNKPRWAVVQYENEDARRSIELALRAKLTLAKLYMNDIIVDNGTYLAFERMTTGGGFKGVGSDSSEPLWSSHLLELAVQMDRHGVFPEEVEKIYDFLEQRRSVNVQEKVV